MRGRRDDRKPIPGLDRVTNVIGEQKTIRQGFLIVHLFFAIGASVLALSGIIKSAEGANDFMRWMILIGGGMGILVSDITLLVTVLSIERRELVGDDLEKAKILHYIALGDVYLGMLAKGFAPIAVFYYGAVMPTLMAILFWRWIELILYGEGATIDREARELEVKAEVANWRMGKQQQLDAIARQMERLQNGKARRDVRKALNTRYLKELAAEANTSKARSRMKRIARQLVFNFIGDEPEATYLSGKGRFMRAIGLGTPKEGQGSSDKTALEDQAMNTPGGLATYGIEVLGEGTPNGPNKSGGGSGRRRGSGSRGGTRHGNLKNCRGCDTPLPDGWTSIYCPDPRTGKPSQACKQKAKRKRDKAKA